MLAFTLSHFGFVFERPFIFEALVKDQNQPFAVIITGDISAAMAGVSLLALGVSKRLGQKLGLAGILLLTFGIEISTNGTWKIENCICLSTILLLRIVQDAFTLSFILATLQSLLEDNNHQTFFSLFSDFRAAFYLPSPSSVMQNTKTGPVF